MYRFIEKSLTNWRQSERKKPLIIKGARQVGKTYSIREFAKSAYKHVVEINFERDLEYVDFFNKTRKPEEIISFILLSHLEYAQVPCEELLFFFDEIQACPSAITSLKFLSESCPYDIICSGSMLGIAITNTSSFPVGYVETWDMYPMSFHEFLLALQVKETYIDQVKQSLLSGSSIPLALHDRFSEFFKIYVQCGGMPEVVQTYIKTKSFIETLSVQRRIVNDYINDMAKYAERSEKLKVHECFSSLPLQLAKENKKFQYKYVKKGYNARYYDTSLRWLEDSGLILKVNRLQTITHPLEAAIELNIFKIYMFDTGLLLSQFDESSIREVMSGNMNIFKGALYENIAAQILRCSQKKMYYHEPNTSAEIDFIIHYQGHITPLEVKSGIHTKSTSFNSFTETYNSEQAFRFSYKNVGSSSGNIRYLPIYTLPFLLECESSS